MIAFVAHQLGVDPPLFADYALRDQTRREHAVELQKLLGLRSFGLADWRACLRVGADAAWATDRGEPIVQAMLAHLRATNVLLPAAAVLERIGLAARARARKKTFETLADGLTDAERDTLDGLLTVDPELRRSRFAWLRDYSESPAPSNIVALLDRLEYARGLGIDAARAGRIHAARLARLIDEGAIMTVQHIADLEPARRTAILVVQAAEPRNPTDRCDARHVREIHGHAVQPGAEPGRAAFPGHAARCRQGADPVPPHHRRAPARARRPERTASPWSIARSA